MAVVILGGLVTSTLLNLFVHAVAVPALRQGPAGAGGGGGRTGAAGGHSAGRPRPGCDGIAAHAAQTPVTTTSAWRASNP